MEVTNLQKRVLNLEKEAARKDKELKGLRWIINGSSQAQPLSTGLGLNHSVHSESPTSTFRNLKSTPGASPSRRRYYQSDSSTESHAESIRSAPSESDSQAVSSFHHKSLRQPSTLAEITYNFCPTESTTRRPSKMPHGLGPGAEKMPEMPNKRSSLSSVLSPSPSSSTSSLLTPCPGITMSSLNAIPEGPPSALRPGPSLRYNNSDTEERRALRVSHCTSTSPTPSSIAASSSYSGNIKRSRPPSIAQVLEKSPIMDDVLEKLRPFA